MPHITKNEINEPDWIMAGQIAGRALMYGEGLITKDLDCLSVCKKIEDFIKQEKGNLAFPPQISFNSTAAHFCPTKIDNPFFKASDLLKLDVGVEINGAIGDCALTVDLGNKESGDAHMELVQASKEACENALKIAKTGTQLREIGQVIEETIHKFGFEPIRNLSGHGLGLYKIHTDPGVPNYDDDDKTELEENQTIAIEPFATNGEGFIKEKGVATIFCVDEKPRVRNPNARIILNKINTLPFAAHWFSDMSLVAFALAIKEIDPTRYPPLVEIRDGLVSQHEHTVIVKDKKSIITTKLSD
jgi:methionyl aminopeptidase